MRKIHMSHTIIFLDGAMGTMLQKAGLAPGGKPEIFGMEHPEILKDVHRQYVEAGSQVIYADTFGANAKKLAGTGYSVSEVITRLVGIAKEAAAGRALVALDVGPAGGLLEPLGDLSFEDAYDLYKEMVICGEEAGADLIVFETMTDLKDVRTAVLAAKENSSLPVCVTMAFEESGRTFTGTSVASAALTLSGLGIDSIGINCSLGPEQIYPLIKEMADWTDLPLIAKPNAGLPDADGTYRISPEDFAAFMVPYKELGISMAGGCCGTDPDFIRAIKNTLSGPVTERVLKVASAVCTPGICVDLTAPDLVYGKIRNEEDEDFFTALREQDTDYLLDCAYEQLDDECDILEIDVTLEGTDEAAMMRAAVKEFEGMINVPLCLVSTDPAVIEAGLRAYTGKALVRIPVDDEAVIDAILPVAEHYGAMVTAPKKKFE